MPDILLVANTDWYLFNFRLSLARELRRRGYTVVLASPAGEYCRGIQEAGFRWLEWPVGRQSMNPVGELGALLRLRSLYRQEKPRLVHHFTVKPVLYGSLAAKLAGVPAVVNSVTGLGYLFVQNSPRVRALRWLALQLYRLAFHQDRMRVIFENASDRAFFLQRGLVSLPQTQVIQGVGVDLEKFSPAEEPQEGPPLVVLPARMLWDKGVGDLVEAAHLLREAGQELRLALVGASDPGNPANIPEETLRQWAESGLVEWWGFRADMPAVYRQASLVTLPSLGEGVPTALLEAAACGRAIVATDVPGCREVVADGQTGLLVPPRQPQALAAALASLLGDAPRRQRMGAAGRKRVEELFSDEIVNRATIEVYRSVME